MKRPALLLILACLLPIAAHAQAAPDAAELTQLLRNFLDGAARHDIAAHERFWAEDLIYTRSAGVRMGKQGILANARSSAPAAGESTRYAAEDIRIQQYGDTAVVAFRLVATTEKAGATEVMQFLNTGTFVKRKGAWRAVAWQSTRTAEPESEQQK